MSQAYYHIALREYQALLLSGVDAERLNVAAANVLFYLVTYKI